MGIEGLNRLVSLGIVITLIAAISGFVCVTDAASATYFVSPNGSDSNSGTQAQPFRTLSHGGTVLTRGDTLYVVAGTYAETLYCNINVCIPSGTSSAPVTIAAYQRQTVILQPTSGLRVLNFANNQQYIIIDGLTIDAVNVGYDAIQFEGTSNHITVKNTEVKNAKFQGINIGPNAGSLQVTNSVLHDIGTTSLTHGIYVAGSNNTIEKTTIYNIASYGIHIYNAYAGSSANNNIVRKNRIYNVALDNPGVASGILLSSGTNNLAYDNIVYSNPIGIRAYDGAINNQIYNNTAYNNSNYNIRVEPGATNTQIINNIAYLNGATISDAGVGTTMSNNLTTDPKFVDPATEQFELQSISPAIAKGVTLAAVPDDYADIPRRRGSAYDVGAYEFTSSIIPAAPANLRVVP